MILSDVSKQYLQEEDAVRGFRAAVENGQSRLALQILADIVEAFMEIFQEAMENSDDEDTAPEPASKETAPAVAVNVESTEVADPSEEEAKPKQTQKKEPKVSE